MHTRVFVTVAMMYLLPMVAAAPHNDGVDGEIRRGVDETKACCIEGDCKLRKRCTNPGTHYSNRCCTASCGVCVSSSPLQFAFELLTESVE
jgi:hypothetical protein